MKKGIISAWILVVGMFTSFLSFSQGAGPYFDSSCNAGGEVWVCGRTEVLQVHDDFEENCSDQDYTPCTVLKTVVDYCSPNMAESRIFEEGGPGCPLHY